MKFRYTAFDRAGKPASGVKEANSQAEATELLRREGLYVATITADRGGAGGASSGWRPGGRGGRLKLVATFTRQLAVLVSTGTPVVDALEALERQIADGSFRAAISDLRRRVEEGSTFALAMESHPRYFDAVSRSLVAAGESSGRLDVMLNRLADLTRQQVRVRNTLIGAMVYPCLLMTVAVAVLCLMMLFVLPRFATLFTTLSVPLPPTTRILMAASEFMKDYWYICIGGLGLSIGASVWWLRTPGGVRWLHTIVLRLPQVGRLARSFSTARIARLVGILVESKIQLLEALELTRQACTNVHYIELVGRAQEEVTRGETLSGALTTPDALIHPSVCEAVRNGERTGQIGRVMISMAEFLDEENEVILKSVTSLLEPLILIVLGAVVGLVATSMFMPLFDLTSMAGQPGGAAP